MDAENSKISQRKSKNLHKPPLVLALFRLIFRYLGAIFPSLIGRWAYHLWFLTHRLPTPKREQSWLLSAKSEAVEISSEDPEINGLPVMTYYWENPDNKNAPLIMLVHGWTGRGSQMGAFAEPLLKAGFQVLAYDSHAHGQTPGKASSLFKQSEVQKGLSDKLGPIYGPIYAIVTHSFGGMVTSYSLSEGMQAQKVVCISPTARFDFLLERFAHSLRMNEKVQDNIITRFKKDYGEDLQKRVSSTTTAQQLGHIPVLIIHDENDKDVPISESELLHHAWPNSELKRTKGLGHRQILYDAQVLKNTVDFLKQ